MGLFSSIGKVAGVAAPFIGHAGWAGAASALGQMYATKQEQEWKTSMSNTAHQREVADLRAAGLNPILSATNGGSGASVPNMEVKNPAEAGLVAKTAAKQLQLQEDEVVSRIDLNSASAEKQREEISLVRQQVISEKLEQDLKGSQIHLNEAQAEERWQYVNKIMPLVEKKMESEIAKIEDERLRIQVETLWLGIDMWQKEQMVYISYGQLEVDRQNADTNARNADTNARNADTNARNADTNARNATVNERNADTNARNATVNERNVDTNARNAATNEVNAASNALNTAYEILKGAIDLLPRHGIRR